MCAPAGECRRNLPGAYFKHAPLVEIDYTVGHPAREAHFDSHSDTWDKYFAGQRYSAGTPFRRAVEEGIVDTAHSIQIGLRGSLFQTTDISQSLDLGYDVVTTDEMF